MEPALGSLECLRRVLMMKLLLKRLSWFRVIRSHSKENWAECLKRLSAHEGRYGLSLYGKALRATVMLHQGKFEIAGKIFADLAGAKPVGANDRYVALYSAARLHAMNGDDAMMREAESRARSIRCSRFITRRLPVE